MRWIAPAALISFITCSAGAQTTARYRHLLEDATRSEAAIKMFYRETRQIQEQDDPLNCGFKAMADLLMCKQVLLPTSKWQHFTKGRDLLEASIRRDPVNAELRFMRFCTQLNTPAILGYKSSLTSDRKFLINYLQDQVQAGGDTTVIYRTVKHQLLQSNTCEAAEVNLLKSL